MKRLLCTTTVSATKLIQFMALVLLCELLRYLVTCHMQLEITANKPHGGSILKSLKQESL